MSDIKDAVILAGGKAKRLQGVNENCSKAMMQIAGRPLITYSLDAMLESGIKNINVIYHENSKDILKLSKFSSEYKKALSFIKGEEQKGAINAFAYAKEHVEAPFVMSFGDIMVKKQHFIEMLNSRFALKDIVPDLLIQTVQNSSIPFERNLLLQGNKITKWDKDGVVNEDGKIVKSGGLIYLWNKMPFDEMQGFINNNDRFSLFMKKFIAENNVYEMPIKDIWDIDTPEDVKRSEEILAKSHEM
jgi:NDP-sugar pyrophosphorylase family protein